MTASNDDAARTAREAADWFARLRGDPTNADRSAFELWRSSDARRAQAYDRVAQRWEQTAFLKNTDVVRGRDLDRAGKWHARPGRLIAGSAAAAAVVALALFATLGGRHDPAPAPLTYANASPKPREIVLPDGSRVMLDAGADLEVQFTTAERRLVLRDGRARFWVIRDAERPFVVAADGGSITALGTVFDVTHEGQRVRVTLLEGSVEVAAGGRRKPGGVLKLRPGQQTVYAAGRGPAEPSPAPRRDWADSMLSFENTRLDEAAVAVSRGSQTSVTVTGAAAALRITGAFRIGDPDAFAQAAAAMFNLETARTSHTVVLTKKP